MEAIFNALCVNNHKCIVQINQWMQRDLAREKKLMESFLFDLGHTFIEPKRIRIWRLVTDRRLKIGLKIRHQQLKSIGRNKTAK